MITVSCHNSKPLLYVHTTYAYLGVRVQKGAAVRTPRTGTKPGTSIETAGADTTASATFQLEATHPPVTGAVPATTILPTTSDAPPGQGTYIQ